MTTNRIRLPILAIVSCLSILIAATLTTSAASATSNEPVWNLPFEVGQSWQAGSRHGVNALDFGPIGGSNKKVVAVADGEVRWMHCASTNGKYLAIDHGDGWTTGYYHLVNVRADLVGKQVAAGTHLGDAGQSLPCKGDSTFDHVHLQFYKDGNKFDVNGLTIGGYVQKAGSLDYHGSWLDSSGNTLLTNRGRAVCCLRNSQLKRPPTPDPQPSHVAGHVFTDFNGDGKADVFYSKDGIWRISYGGTAKWKRINTSKADINKLRFGDFDGDDKTDVFYSTGSEWWVSYSATSKWKRINTSQADIKKLRVGDFNGDGKADVFYSKDGIWRISYGGTAKWKRINTSKADINKLRFGDFDGDDKTDVFYSTGSEWWVSYSATSKWKRINTSQADIKKLRVGDFNGDGKADVFYSKDGIWRISYGGTAKWKRINTSKADINKLRFGDFDGDDKTDVFYSTGSEWWVSYSATSKWKRINTSQADIKKLRVG